MGEFGKLWVFPARPAGVASCDIMSWLALQNLLMQRDVSSFTDAQLPRLWWCWVHRVDPSYLRYKGVDFLNLERLPINGFTPDMIGENG